MPPLKILPQFGNIRLTLKILYIFIQFILDLSQIDKKNLI